MIAYGITVADEFFWI